MAEEEIPKEEKNITPVEEVEKIKTIKENFKAKKERERKDVLASWVPKTQLGKRVKEGKEKDIDKILEKGKKILEAEIVDHILNLESEFFMIGQAKGKFGGGKRRVWRQTQKKTKEGNVITFSTMVVVGDKKGHVGIGYGRAKETLPAREKAIRLAKLNITRIERGFEDPADSLKEDPHTVPFKLIGKCGSVEITLMPAPRGTGLCVADECKKLLRLAGIKDVYSRTNGNTRTTFNLIKACIDALQKTKQMKEIK